MLDLAQRGVRDPAQAYGLWAQRWIPNVIIIDDRLGIRLIGRIAPCLALTVGEGGKFAGGDVAQVADHLHRLMIAHQHDHPPASALGLAVKLLQVADDLE